MKTQSKAKIKIPTKILITASVLLLIIAVPLIYFAFLPPTSCSWPPYNNGPRPIGSNSGNYYCKLGVGPINFYKRFSNDSRTGITDQQVVNTSLVVNTANSISNGNGTIKDKAQKIMDWLHSSGGLTPGNCGNADVRGRTADQILSSKCTTGCADWTLAFVALARVKGISSTITETVNDSWVSDSQERPDGRPPCLILPKDGHFFSEIYTGASINGGWEIADPTFGDFTTTKNGFVLRRSPGDCFGCGKNYRFFRRGLSSWDYNLWNDNDFTNAAKQDIGVSSVCSN